MIIEIILLGFVLGAIVTLLVINDSIEYENQKMYRWHT